MSTRTWIASQSRKWTLRKPDTSFLTKKTSLFVVNSTSTFVILGRVVRNLINTNRGLTSARTKTIIAIDMTVKSGLMLIVLRINDSAL